MELAGDRLRDDSAVQRDRLTFAVADGFAIAHSPDAYRRYMAARHRVSAQPAQSSAEFTATVDRLASLFPGKVRSH